MTERYKPKVLLILPGKGKWVYWEILGNLDFIPIGKRIAVIELYARTEPIAIRKLAKQLPEQLIS